MANRLPFSKTTNSPVFGRGLLPKLMIHHHTCKTLKPSPDTWSPSTTMVQCPWSSSAPLPKRSTKWVSLWLPITLSQETRTLSSKRELPGERSFKIRVSDAIYSEQNPLATPPTTKPWKRLPLLWTSTCALISALKIPNSLHMVPVTSKILEIWLHSNHHAANILELQMTLSKGLRAIPSRRVTQCSFSTAQAATSLLLLKTAIQTTSKLLRKIWFLLTFWVRPFPVAT